jgi:hypothetical protein
MVESAFDAKEFLPNGSLSTILTRPVMEGCLLNASPELLDFTWSQGRKHFAILISIGYLGDQLQSTMEQFKSHRFTDSELPYSSETTGRSPFRGWRRYDVRRFFDVQWKFLAPVFEEDTFRYDFEPQRVLPFRDLTEGASGYFSQVSRVMLDKDHQRGLFSVGLASSSFSLQHNSSLTGFI